METISNNKEMAAFVREFENYFRYLSELGCTGFSCEDETIGLIKSWGRPKKPVPDTLASIQKDIEKCTACDFSATRNRTVFGKGKPDARLVFVGDWPGFPEDREGAPFLGEAGDLLTKILAAINQSRDSVYLMNILKCRPSEGVVPHYSKVKPCLRFLARQIRVIKPEYICTLGSFAAQALLDTDLPVSKLRGRFHDFMGIKLMATYHPTLLLKDPAKKRDVWEDMKRLMAVMG